MGKEGQNCAEQKAESDYADDRGLLNPTKQVSDKHRTNQDYGQHN
jgi:hypothetical protein